MTVDQGEDVEYSRFRTDLAKGQEQCLGQEEEEFHRLRSLLDYTGAQLSDLGFLKAIERGVLDGDAQETAQQTNVSRWLVGRLCVLQRLDWLNAICKVLLPDSRGRNLEKIRNDRMRLYWGLHDRNCVEIAYECARAGDVDVLVQLIRIYPYTLLPSIMDILRNLFVIVEIEKLERILGVLLEMRRYSSDGGPPITRDADWAERKEVVALLNGQDTPWKHCTERVAKIYYGWHTPSDAQIESWVLQHSLEVERSTGLYQDAMSLAQSGGRLLEQHGYSSTLLGNQVLLFQEYEVCLRLRSTLKMHGILNGLQDFPKDVVQYLAAGMDGRMVSFLRLALLYQHTMDIDDMIHVYLKKYFDLQKEQDPNTEDILSSVLLEISYPNKEWILGLLKAEGLHPCIFSGRDSLISLCLDIMLYDPGEGMESGTIAQRLAFQTMIFEMTEELIMETNNEDLRRRFEVASSTARIVSLMLDLGKNLEMREASALLDSGRAHEMLEGIIEEKRELCAPKKEWNRLQEIVQQLSREFRFNSEYTERLQELICQSSLRLGHLTPTETYSKYLEPNKKERVLTKLAHGIICIDTELKIETINSAKRVLSMLPDSSNIQKQTLLVDTVAKLRELGIEVSPDELEESSNVSQLFQSAIQNVTSTRGLYDIDRIIDMFGSLDMTFTSDEILQQLAETAVSLSDAPLCEKLCGKLIDSESLTSLPIITKVLQSDMNINPESRQKMLSFSMQHAKDKDILKALSWKGNARASHSNILDEIIDGNMIQGDETAILMQIAAALFSKDMKEIIAWVDIFFASNHEMFESSLRRLIYTGILSGVSLKILSICMIKDSGKSFGLDHSSLMQLPISTICFLGSKNVETPIEGVEQNVQQALVKALERLGESIISIADETRLSVINNKNAERLWGTGDINAQKQLLKQMTDKIAASQVSHLGVIHSIDPLVDSEENENIASELSDVGILARRCGIEYEEVEEMFVECVLYRHGCSKALGHSWVNTCTKRPSRMLKLVLEFSLTSRDLGNYEVLRSIDMVEQCINNAFHESQLESMSGLLKDIYQNCIDFVENSSLDLRPIIEPFFIKVYRRCVGEERVTKPTFCVPQWFMHVAQPENAMYLYEFLKQMSVFYHDMTDRDLGSSSEDYPVHPNVLILSALSKMLKGDCSSTSVSQFLTGLSFGFLISLGLSVGPALDNNNSLEIPTDLENELNAITDDNLIHLYRSIIDLTRSAELSPGNTEARSTIIKNHANLICRRDLYELSADENLMMGIRDLSVKLADCDSDITQLAMTPLSICVYDGAKYDTTIARLMDTISQLSLNQETIDKHEILHNIYVVSLNTCLEALKGSAPGTMTKGEAIQNIFGIVRSLDCPLCEGLEPIQISVYNDIKEYLSGSSGSKVDPLYSEIQIQLMEMMMAIGKDKWVDWQPKDTDLWSFQPESLLYSRLISHFSTSWEDAMDHVEQTSLATCGDTNAAFCELSAHVSTSEQADALWCAMKDIIYLHYEKDPAALAELQESFTSVITCVFRMGTTDAILTALDDFVMLYDQIPPELQELASESLSDHSEYVPLVKLMTTIDKNVSASTATDLFHLIESNETPAHRKMAAVLATVHFGLIPELVQEHGISVLRHIVQVVDSALVSRDKASFISEDGQNFYCPLRVPIYSQIISELVLSRDNVAASYLAFETLGLDGSLRVKDSGVPVISGLLSSLCDVSWSKKQSDLSSLKFPGTSILAHILQEFPVRCSKALELCG